jgi:hypothetical protein
MRGGLIIVSLHIFMSSILYTDYYFYNNADP